MGGRLLDHATGTAQAAQCSAMTIMANSANAGACRLYLRLRFAEIARRASVPFQGSYDRGDWIQFKKSV
jgi:ribosomal protein S18 acetylase RimI-like enzyme